MTKTKFLVMSVVFALTYITCDVFFIFYIAGETDQATTAPVNNNNTSFQQRASLSRAQYAFANESDYALKPVSAKPATILE